MEISNLLSMMTLDEKIGQCMQVCGDYFDSGNQITGPIQGNPLPPEALNCVGSVLGVSGADKVRYIQSSYLERNRLKIPLCFMGDVVHGYKTIFPIPLAMAGSFNLDLCRESASIAAVESALSGLHVTFAPMVDLVRDPRWGRVMESGGEDAYLISMLAEAYVKGFQNNGDIFNNACSLAACVKHFAGYGASEGGRDYNTVDMSDRMLREFYLPGFKAAVKAGVAMVMTAFSTINSIPATANSWLLQDVLRHEWKFEGVVISDWTAISELINHGIAVDNSEAAYKSLLAGVDIDMMSPCYYSSIKKLIRDGSLREDVLDRSVYNVLKLKYDLGLFDNPFRGIDLERASQVILSKDHKAAAFKAACESIVLLKNDGVLPLQDDESVVFIGDKVKEKRLNGEWSCCGTSDDVISIYEALVDSSFNYEIIESQSLSYADQWKIKQADKVVLVIGEDETMSGEAHSRTSISLKKDQIELLIQVRQFAKKIILVNFSGRPLDLSFESSLVDGLIQAWYLGTMSGQAIVDTLYGINNPSAKLTMSFPRNVGQVPIYYNCFNTGRPFVAGDGNLYLSKYDDCLNSPLYPFGYGLNYSDIQIVSVDVELIKDVIVVRSVLKNYSSVSGAEVLQVYVRDISACVVRPIKELKAFKKIFLSGQEEAAITINLHRSDLSYFNQRGEFVYQEGEFNIMVGFDSEQLHIVGIDCYSDSQK
jgi:beta-glucosidase